MKKLFSILLVLAMIFATCATTVSAYWTTSGYYVVIGSSVSYRYGPSYTGYTVVPVTPATYGTNLFGIYSVTHNYLESKDWASTGNGWICMDFCIRYYSAAADPNRHVTTGGSSLTVRQGPTTSAPSIGSLSNGTSVFLIAETSGTWNGHYWGFIDYGSTQGWVACTYLTVD